MLYSSRCLFYNQRDTDRVVEEPHRIVSAVWLLDYG